MSSLASYYKISAVLFLIDGVCDFIFNSSYGTCPYTNSAAGIFLIIAYLNIILFILLLITGLVIGHFSELDPDELINLGFVKKILGVLTKLFPRIIKLIHLLKIILVLVTGFFAFANNTLTMDYLTEQGFNATLYAGNPDCLNVNATSNNITMTSYPQSVQIFELIEVSSVVIALCILGIIKNMINIDGYFYEPEDLSHGSCRKLVCRKYGP